MADKTFTYGINFAVNRQGISTIKNELVELKRSVEDRIKLGVDTGQAQKDLYELYSTTEKLSNVISNSWNNKLGQLNLTSLNKGIQKEWGSIEGLYTSMTKANVSGQKAFDQLALSVLHTNVQLKNTSKWMDELGQSFTNTIKWGISSTVFNGVTSALQKSFSYAQNLDKSLNNIKIVAGDAAGNMEQFAKHANAAAKNLGASTLDYTNAALIYYQQGDDAATAQAKADITLKAANVTGQSGEAVSEQLTAVWNGYKVDAAEAELYIDKLAAVAATTAADLEELSTGMSKVASAANLMGVDVDQLNASLATIVSVTRQAPESVGTALKTIYARMGDIESGLDAETTLGTYTEEMKAIAGINVLDANDNLRDMGDVIEEVGNKWTTLTREQQIALSQTMAGTRQYNNLLSLFDNWDMYTEALNTSKTAAGELQRQQDIYMESTAAHLQRLSTEAERTYDIIFDEKVVNALTDGLTGIITSFNNFFDSLGGGLPLLTSFVNNILMLNNKNLAKGIEENFIENLQGWSENKKQLEVQKDILQRYGLAGATQAQVDEAAEIDPALQAELKYAEKIYNLKKYITNAEAEELIKKQEKLGLMTKELHLAQTYQDIQTDVAKMINPQDIPTESNDLEGWSRIEKNAKDQYLEVSRRSGAFSKLISLRNAITTVGENEAPYDLRTLEDRERLIDKYSKEISSFVSNSPNTIKELNQFAPDFIPDLKTWKEVKKVFVDYQNLKEKAEEEGGVFTPSKKQQQEVLKAVQKLKLEEQSLGKVEQQIAQDRKSSYAFYKKTQDITTGIRNEASLAEIDAEEQKQQLENELQLQILQEERQKRIAQTIQATTMVVQGIQSIVSLINILRNEDLSFGEKLGAIAASLVPLTMTAVKGFQLLKSANDALVASMARKQALTAIDTTISAINAKNMDIETAKTAILNAAKEQGIKLTEEEIAARLAKMGLAGGEAVAEGAVTAGKAAENIATKKLTASQWSLNAAVNAFPLMWIIAGIGLLVGAITFAITSYKSAEEKAAEAVEKTTEAYNDATSALSNYQSAKEGVDNLTEGTLEWYNAIIKANEAAQELIDLWELAAGKDYTLGAGGLIQFNEESLENKQFQAQQAVYRAQGMQFQVKANQASEDLQSTIYDFRKDLNSLFKQYGYESVDMKIAEKILNNEEFTTQVGESLVTLTNHTADISENTMCTTQAIQDLEMSKLMSEYTASYGSLQNQLREYQRSVVDSYIRGSGSKDQIAEYDKLTAKMRELIQDSIADHLYSQNKEYSQLKSRDEILNTNKRMPTYAEMEKDENGKVIIQRPNDRNLYQDIYGANKKAATDKEVNEWYAKHVLGATKSKDGKWTDASGEQKSLSKIIDADAKKNGTTQEQRKTAKDTKDALDYTLQVNARARKEAAAQGLDEDSQSYVAEAKLALMNAKTSKKAIGGYSTKDKDGKITEHKTYSDKDKTIATPDYDFSLLTDSELDEVKRQLQEEYNTLGEKNRQKLQEEIGQGPLPENIEETDAQKNIRAMMDYVDQVKGTASETKRTHNDLINYNAELERQAGVLETTDKALKLYAKATVQADKDLQKKTQSTARAAAEEYKFNKAYNEGVETFDDAQDAYKAYVKAIKNGDKVSYDVADSVGEIQTSLEELLGLEVDADFMADYSDQITKLFTGTEEEAEAAYKTLSNLALERSFRTMATEAGIAADKLDTFMTKFREIQNSDTEVKFKANKDEFIQNLNTMMGQTMKSRDEVQKWLNDHGLKLSQSVDNKAAIKEYDIPGQETTTTHTIQFTDGINPYTGKEQTKPITWTETNKTAGGKYFALTNEDEDIAFEGNPRSMNTNFTVSQANQANRNKGSSNKPEKMDALNEEFDRYHEVNTQIEKLSNSLSYAQAAQDNLVGQDFIDNLKEQWQLLNNQVDNYNEKLDIANNEQEELKNKLAAQGVLFNSDGTVSNYVEALKAQENAVNALINNYNGMSGEQQDAYKDTVEQAKKNFEKFQENIDRYDELISSEIPGILEEIQNAANEMIELKIEAFHHEIEIRLDMAEAERDWNEFYTKIIKDIDEDDILGNTTERLKDFMSYYKDSAEGIIQVNTQHIQDILNELKAMDEGGIANVYQEDTTKNRAQALEDLKEYYEQLMSDLTDIHDLSDEIHESYVDMIDEAQEKFDEQIETFEKINELLEHDKNVISMIYGEESYSALAQYYDKQEENNNKQLDFQKQQVEFWKQQMEIAEEGSDAWEAAKENWMSAVDEWNSAVEAAIENLQNKYLNAINAIFQNLNNQVTNGLGLDYTESQWELINKNADQYLDSVNSIYQVQQLQNKYLDAIEKTDSPAQQKRLNDLMKQETDYLREQDKLSQYDLDRANLKYEIALKQMALEEAQQNKTMLRLRRDSQGNYTYQYTADEDQVSSIQQEIADLYNQLYNLDAEEYRGNLEEIYDVWLEFQEKMAEAAQINDPEQRAAKELLIKEQYGELINTLVEKNENAQANLYQSTMSHLFDLYNQNIVNYDEMSQEQRDILDQFMSAETDLSNAAFDNLFNLYNVNIESFKTMTDEQQEILMGSLVPQWNTAVQMMVDNIAGAGGFVPTCKEAFEEIDEATQDYMTGLEELQKNANVSFDELKDGIDETIIETEKLLEDNNELISSYEQEIEAIRGVIDELEELISKYQAASDAAKKATEDAYNYWLAEQDKNATIDATLPDPNEGIATTDNAPVETKAATSTQSPPSLNYGSFIDVKPGARWYSNSAGGGTSGPAQSGTISIINGNSHGYHIIGSQYGSGWIKKSDIVGYDTGGYTGDWANTDGRLAMLHQKELVLNANDTQNVLNAVEILRDITSNLGNTLFSRMAAISAGGASAIANGVAAEGIEQNVHIDAQFPNVTNSHEIEDALNNLMNRASQFIQQSR